MVVNINVAVFWVMTPHNLVGGYEHFGRRYCLQGALKMHVICSSKTFVRLTRLYGAVTIRHLSILISGGFPFKEGVGV
jgi:hypothetical protein